MTTRTTVAITLWLAAIALAMCVDRAVAVWLHNAEIDLWLRTHHHIAEIFKTPGAYACTVVVVIIVTLTHAKRRQAGGFVVLATLVSGINYVVKWAAGRCRPFKLDHLTAQPFVLTPFRGGIHGFMKSENLCFPSGHASLAFATAAAVAMLWPRAKWRWIGYAIATFVAIERVLENAHWLSDAVAGAALGVASVHVTAWALTKLRPTDEKQAATVS